MQLSPFYPGKRQKKLWRIQATGSTKGRTESPNDALTTDVSVHSEGPATSHLETGSLMFPLSSISQVPSCYCELLMQPSRFKLIQIKPPLLSKSPNCFSKIYNSPLIQETKIPRALSQATTCNHPNVFTSTLPLSEGRTGGAWGPSDKTMFFLSLPKIKCVLLL
jgi:hypothetical protein